MIIEFNGNNSARIDYINLDHFFPFLPPLKIVFFANKKLTNFGLYFNPWGIWDFPGIPGKFSRNSGRVAAQPGSVQNFNGCCRALAKGLSRHNPRDGVNTPSFDPLLHPCCTLSPLGPLPSMHIVANSALHKLIHCASGSIRSRCGLWPSIPPRAHVQ